MIIYSGDEIDPHVPYVVMFSRSTCWEKELVTYSEIGIPDGDEIGSVVVGGILKAAQGTTFKRVDL